jgi:cytochrome c oxidase assembly protein subunit 11
MSQPQYNKSNGRVAFWLVTAVFGMVCLAYASSPLYDLFCRTTGFAGTPIRVEEGERPVIARTVNVRFDSTVDPNLAWRFEPLEREVKVHLGEEKLVFFRATNKSQRPIVGTAVYNVTPEPAGPWFNKVQCFCFTEQLLQPGQSVDLPVTFFVDPDMDKDRRYDNVRTITLSYTFYEAKTERAKILLGELASDRNSERNGKGG